jgi:hypothetical protein
MDPQPLEKEPLHTHPDIAWGAVRNDGKVVGHRGWKEVTVVHNDGQTLFAIPETKSATHFVWAGDGSEFAYVHGDEKKVAIFKRQKHNLYIDESQDSITCVPNSLSYFQNASGSTNTIMHKTNALNRRGKADTFTLIGHHDAQLHVSGACADKTCVYGIDMDDHRLIGYPHVQNSQFYLFQPHPDDAHPNQNHCATNGEYIAVAGETTLRLFKCKGDDRTIKWQVETRVVGVPFFLGLTSVATLERNGHALVFRDTRTGAVQHVWGIRFTLRVLPSSNGKYVIFNMADGSSVVFDAGDLLPL